MIEFVVLTGYVAAVTIEPTNRVARKGENMQLMCKVRGVIKSCFWEINGNLFSLNQGGKYEPVGNLLDGECGVMVRHFKQKNSIELGFTARFTCRRRSPTRTTANGRAGSSSRE